MLKPATREAYQLLHDGAIAFSRMSETGLRVDVPYLNKSIAEVKQQLQEAEGALRSDRVFEEWAKCYGNAMNLESPAQLGKVLFDIIGYKRNPFMGKSNDVAAFEHLKIPFKDNYFFVRRMRKALNTYLYGILNETVDGYIHPMWDVHTAESYRSSSSKPNFHNQPVRNKVVSKTVRSSIIPRPGHVLLEADLSTHEVKTAYCHCKDERLRYDIEHGDMHKDRSMELYLLTEEQLGPINKEPGKLTRYIGKNKFVFAQFYGSFYKQCAPDLWDAISLYDLRRSDGTSLFEHLAAKGIAKLGRCDVDDNDYEPDEDTFEYHVQQVERRMWKEHYTVYDQWKKDWWNLYQLQGGINTLTGFRMYGVYRRNQILCDPNQGSAFHCLLWAFIQIQREFMKRRMKSRVINQIHDSLLIDAHKAELWDVVEIVRYYMTDAVAKHWPWIIIPLGVDFEIAEHNWYEKHPLEKKAA